ncbi:hypothetical protein EDB83DRAFT_2512052 [Lactarius deliciosus]|nr:hypothetical protein EDB83DRAFT_2512052 [Lactarius deliciosus]
MARELAKHNPVYENIASTRHSIPIEWGMEVNGKIHDWPEESKSGMFGGNSNWRGPIWLAVNLLLIESL